MEPSSVSSILEKAMMFKSDYRRLRSDLAYFRGISATRLPDAIDVDPYFEEGRTMLKVWDVALKRSFGETHFSGTQR
jgi:hypothetical protein